MKTKEPILSKAARSLWGKLSHDGSHQWLPLWVHLCDTGEIMKLLWDRWVPLHTKKIIAEGIRELPDQDVNRMDYARKIAVFMAVGHDLGKISPLFVAKAAQVGFSDVVNEITEQGLSVRVKSHGALNITHAVISQAILEDYGWNRSYAVVVGGHHGKPPNADYSIEEVKENPTSTGVKSLEGKVSEWSHVQGELVQMALAQADLSKPPEGEFSIEAQVLLTGVLIMADWIASGEGFPLISHDYAYHAIESSQNRAKNAWDTLKLPEFKEFSDPCSWDELYQTRFGIETPRPMQQCAVQVASKMSSPGIVVIEAPMGEGKTEAALAAAEVMARKYGLSGVYFALPTQATSDGIFGRIETWIRNLHAQGNSSILLAHGKAGFNKDYEGIKIYSHMYSYDEGSRKNSDLKENVIVHDWTQGRKKGLLSDFVVGTIDQILMCGLKQKHLALRHLGVANKVVIIDECHAYDTYMSSYLDLVLSWLGAYHVPVIVLSATLPLHRRNDLIRAYRKSWEQPKKRSMLQQVAQCKKTENADTNKQKKITDYPLISYTDKYAIKTTAPEKSGRKLSIRMVLLSETKLLETLDTIIVHGGCVGIIRNTVSKAQETARMLEEHFGASSVRLLHSRFISCDRVWKEEEVRSLLGPPNSTEEAKRPEKLIVVGSQVMEQSLDIDLDVLFSDICPMDLLLQRMGRLHRHVRSKPRPPALKQPTCFVMGIKNATKFDEGSTAVYGQYLLLKTRAFLKEQINMPDDIPELVQQSYEDGYDEEMMRRLSLYGDSGTIKEVCYEAKTQYDSIIAGKKNSAVAYQIMNPVGLAMLKSLVGWLKADKKDNSGKRGEATVRDAESSLDVLVIVKKKDGYLYTLPGLKEYADTRIISPLIEELAKVIAGCSVSLPACLAKQWNIDSVIEELESAVLNNGLDNLYESYWLDGELFLVLNEQYETKLLNKVIVYSHIYGLYIKEEEV